MTQKSIPLQDSYTWRRIGDQLHIYSDETSLGNTHVSNAADMVRTAIENAAATVQSPDKLIRANESIGNGSGSFSDFTVTGSNGGVTIASGPSVSGAALFQAMYDALQLCQSVETANRLRGQMQQSGL